MRKGTWKFSFPQEILKARGIETASNVPIKITWKRVTILTEKDIKEPNIT